MRSSPLPLLLRFAILSTVAVLVLGAGLNTVAMRGIQARALKGAEEKARVIATVGIDPHVSERALQRMDRAQLDRVDALLRTEHLRATGVARVKIFNDEPRVVYSDNRRQVGRSAADSELVRRALAGQVGSKLVTGTDHSGRGERMLEVFVPLLEHKGRRAGALEVYLPYAPVEESIRVARRRLNVALAVGLALLWAALFSIVSEASTALRRRADENRRQALHDPLTGLPNRALLYDRMERAFARAERHGEPFSIVLFDLDGFKNVNDSLGHQAGDDLLRHVGDRLRAVVRTTDTAARLGGDEFAIVLADTPVERCHAFVEPLLTALRRPLSAAGTEVRISASVGIAEWTTGSTPDELVRNADLGMYEAKATGDDAVIFEPAMHTALVERLALEGDMRRALEQKEFVLHYQPIVSSADGRVHALEALIRWPDERRGLVSPGEFIPAAERSGLIREIGDWVLDEACRQLSRWRQEGILAADVAVSVNVLASQLADAGLPARVRRALDRHRVPARNLIVEITESVLMEEQETAEHQLRTLRGDGVVVALDDFGTGYSSLSRLASLPVDYLKVDRSFVNKIETVAAGNPLTATIVAMGRSLGLRVVAEGVETTEQLTALRRLQCDSVQGYLLSRPVAAEEVPALLEHPFPVQRLTARVSSTTSEVEDELAELMASLVNGAGSPEELVRLVLAELQKITGMESTYVTRIGWEREEQDVLYALNAGALRVPEGLTVAWSDTLCRRALADGRRHIADVTATYPESEAAAALGLRSFISVPVTTFGGAVVGTLCGASGERLEVPDSVLTLMELFARLLGERLSPTSDGSTQPVEVAARVDRSLPQLAASAV